MHFSTLLFKSVISRSQRAGLNKDLRTKMLESSVAGRQNRTTKMSAIAKLTFNSVANKKEISIGFHHNQVLFITMKQLVTVLIWGTRKTTATTKQLPIKPRIKTNTSNMVKKGKREDYIYCGIRRRRVVEKDMYKLHNR